MSAIAGIYHFNNNPVSHEEVANVLQALSKYPADDIQVWKKEMLHF